MPKKFPRTHKALVLEGFKYLAAGTCEELECRAPVLWYLTPRGKRMPIDADRKIPHWWCCTAIGQALRKPRARQFELFPAASFQ